MINASKQSKNGFTRAGQSGEYWTSVK